MARKVPLVPTKSVTDYSKVMKLANSVQKQPKLAIPRHKISKKETHHNFFLWIAEVPLFTLWGTRSPAHPQPAVLPPPDVPRGRAEHAVRPLPPRLGRLLTLPPPPLEGLTAPLSGFFPKTGHAKSHKITHDHVIAFPKFAL